VREKDGSIAQFIILNPGYGKQIVWDFFNTVVGPVNPRVYQPPVTPSRPCVNPHIFGLPSSPPLYTLDIHSLSSMALAYLHAATLFL
jgi:hypothetical protein